MVTVQPKGFSAVDYVVFALTLLISMGIGIYYAISGGRQKTTKEYLMGNRSLRVIPVALSMFMSYISAILVLGNTAEMYTRGTQFWLGSIGSMLAFGAAALIFVPLFYPLNLTSSFEYLEVRYQSKIVKLTGTVFLIIYQIIYMGIAMYSPATALEAVTSFPVWASILASGVVATFYTTLGGIKAVVWTDVFQGVIMVGGLIAVLATGTARVGGIERVWKLSEEGGRIAFWNFNVDPTVRLSFWSIILGRFFISLNTVGTGQTSVQRYCSVSTLRRARWSVFLNVPAIVLLYSLTCLVGLTVYAYYSDIKCDPLKAGYISNANQLLPFFIMDQLSYPGLPGVLLAVLFSGALSTLSSSLNALSAVTWKDMLEWKFHYVSEERKAMVTKLLVAVYGAAAIGMAFIAETLGGHVLQASQSFVGGVGGPSVGLFILGTFFPWANWKGAFVGGISGLGVAGWIAVGAYVTKPHRAVLPTDITGCPAYVNMTVSPDPTNPPDVFPLYKISYMWYATIGMLVTIIIGLIVSLITGPMDPKKHDPRYIIPVFDRLCCCIPKRFRRYCWCGVDHDSITDETEEEDGEKELEMEDMPKQDHTAEMPPPYSETNGLAPGKAANGRAAGADKEGIPNAAFEADEEITCNDGGSSEHQNTHPNQEVETSKQNFQGTLMVEPKSADALPPVSS